jgi:predicted Zn-dependent protease
MYFSEAFSVNANRDSKVEAMMKELAQLLFSAADIDDNGVTVFAINDTLINAYAIDNNSIFR